MQIVIAGIGKLGTALLTQFEKCGISLGVFHPNSEKASLCVQKYSLHKAVTMKELGEADLVMAAVPANRIDAFTESIKSLHKPLFINMATAVPTSRLQKQYSSLQWTGVKFVGQADDLRENGNGLFVIEEPHPVISGLYSQIGRVIVDKEETVEKVNRLATYYAIKAAKELENELRSKGYNSEYEKQVLQSLVPGVVRSYAQGTLGHFGKEIAAQLDNEKRS
ncbi:NAD(P)-binding domain-containing protein [Bacillus sp. 165]|uniref:NAD(P)-binding domain-containing protein n=1 Tax=Bacillus sp. 165 TaxID=1529117 RepID=UPI001AD9AAFE|nr:NAD(P)-binding domain-containing protein [Bacillus sp. 165]MBO9129533.1 NAD(P)-binding domain-containing protein [Bacillus sp. 165]